MAGPDNDYWDHVDWIVDSANALGLYIAFVPTWGDQWNLKWGEGPEIFTPDNARAVKPVLDGEPIYEDHPVSFKVTDLGHSIASDVSRPLLGVVQRCVRPHLRAPDRDVLEPG